MPRLLEAAQQLQSEKETPKSIKASSDLGISKAVAARWLSSDEFYNVKVDVDKLPLLAGEVIAAGEVPRHLVVVDLNKNKVNRSAAYTPKITVVCGADLVRSAKKNKVSTIDCWISAKAAKAIRLKLPKVEANIGFSTNPSPKFTPGPALGTVSLPTNVMHTRSLAFPDAIDFGAPGSELNNPQMMTMLNIEEALAMYLGNLKNGIWKPISSQWALVPPSLVNATNEAGLIAKDKKLQAFSPLDFVYFQQDQLNAPLKLKYVGKDRLSAKKFAFVAEEDDPSTWLFRADSMDAIKASIGELRACKYLSTKAKQLTLFELKKRSQLYSNAVQPTKEK